IGDYAFYNSGIKYMNGLALYSLTSDHYNVNLPESLTLLKSHAFDGAYNIKTLKIMEQLSIDLTDETAQAPIEEYAFANEANLYDVKFENNFVGEFMFANDVSIEELVVDSCVKIISHGFLYETINLKKLTVPFIGRTQQEFRNEDGEIDYSYRGNDAILSWFFALEKDVREEYTSKMTKITQEYDEDATTWAYIPNALVELTITEATYLSYGALDQFANLQFVNLETDQLQIIDNYAFRNTGIKSIIIPASVLELHKGAFMDDRNLRSVRFAPGFVLEVVEEETFRNCPNLVMNQLPDTVITIGDYAFFGDTSITRFKISENVTSIGYAAFGLCTSLEEMEIPYVGGHVYTETFEEVKDLDSRHLHDSEETIFGWIFGKEGNKLTTSARMVYNEEDFEKLNDNISSIEPYYIPTALKKVTITSGIGIGYGAFMNCSEIKEIILPMELKFIGQYAFYGCWELNGIDIPRGVEIIGDGAFQNSGIEFIEIWNPVIGNSQFANCKKLHTVIAHDTVEEIGQGAFTGCTLLENLTIPFVGRYNYTKNSNREPSYETSFVYIFGTDVIASMKEFVHVHDGVEYIIPETKNKEEELLRMTYTEQIFVDVKGDYTKDEYCYGYIPNSLMNLTITNQEVFATGALMNVANNMNDEKNHPQVDHINLKLPESTLVEIGNRAFEGAESFHTITMPDTVTEIGVRSFAENSKLTHVDFSNNLARLEDEAFLNDKALEMNTVLDCVQEIGDRTFVGCDSIVRFDFNKVIEIGKEAFMGGKLMTIDLQHVNTIKDSAFRGNLDLLNIVVPADVVNLGEYVFAESGVTTFQLDNNLIGAHMFDTCDNLVKITIPASINEIRPYAFANCKNLGKDITKAHYEQDPTKIAITFENEVIGERMFDNDTALSYVVIPSQITTIGDYAFSNCTGITDIKFENEYVGKYMFFNCEGLTVLTVTNNITTIDIGAFEECDNLVELTLPFVGKEAGNNDSIEALFGWIFGEAREDEDYPTTTQYYRFEEDIYYLEDRDENAVALEEEKDWTVDFKIPAKLTKVTFTDETVVGYGAFSNAENLTSINFSQTLTKIDNYAFYNCLGLTEFVVPDSLETIGYAAFKGCDNLVKITIPFVGKQVNISDQIVVNSETGDVYGERAYFGWIFGKKVTSASLR
ncbi:MAG: leucine-rich repeat domain-containing protein, partial [Anaeroplasmataceae bacterium]|nr:leucine-rich repeat domain-containing protein [Anaeroplasmataceae bacterium]